MSTDEYRGRSLQWLAGTALLEGGESLPLMACASKSSLRATDAYTADRRAHAGGGRVGLRLIFNDDHGMTPSVTIVNQTDAAVVLRAVRPSLVSTDHGTYDLDALLADGDLTVRPGSPMVIRISDIGRNAGEPFRVAATARHGAAPGGAIPSDVDLGAHALPRRSPRE